MTSRRKRPAHPADYYGVEDVVGTITDSFHLDGRPRGREYDIPCPNPKHDDRSPSCGVNTTTGYWNCFSCGVGGDIAELGSLVLGLPVEDIERMLSPHTTEALLTRLQGRMKRLTAKPMKNKPYLLPHHPEPLKYQTTELLERDFSLYTIAKWGLRWVPEATLPGQEKEYTIRQSIAIPIRDATGELRAWCYRSTNESPQWQPRYLYTYGVELSELWWGDEFHASAPRVTVVEGALDGMWCDQNGFPARALLGSKMGDKKILRLQDHKSVTLLGDLDAAGMQWVSRVGEMVGKKMPLYVAQYNSWMMKKRAEPDGTWRRAGDPEELRPVDLELVHARALPYASWRLKRAQAARVG